MTPSINLQTKTGLELYNSTNTQYRYSKEHNFLTEFKYSLTMRYTNLEKKLIDWIDTHEMETEEEMSYWRNQAETITVLKYFAERLV
jgi:3-dehydroquinate dehydratase